MKGVKDLKVPGKLNYKQISKEYEIPENTLSRRVFKLKIKGTFVGAKKYFDQAQIKKMLKETQVNLKNHHRKITVIEYFNKGFSGREIAEILGMSVALAYQCIKEYQLTECIVVESKINYRR